jgi:hypothetical protein
VLCASVGFFFSLFWFSLPKFSVAADPCRHCFVSLSLSLSLCGLTY